MITMFRNNEIKANAVEVREKGKRFLRGYNVKDIFCECVT